MIMIEHGDDGFTPRNTGKALEIENEYKTLNTQLEGVQKEIDALEREDRELDIADIEAENVPDSEEKRKEHAIRAERGEVIKEKLTHLLIQHEELMEALTNKLSEGAATVSDEEIGK